MFQLVKQAQSLDEAAFWNNVRQCWMELALSQSDGPRRPPPRGGNKAGQKPGWADGLKQLYDSVVQEPLPPSFDDLLKKLDQRGDDND
jgi:hypothetical protein